MSIDVGGKIISITQRTVMFGSPPQPLYVRDVTFEMVGIPLSPGPTFTVAITDATQWNQLQVDQTCTIAIHPPA